MAATTEPRRGPSAGRGTGDDLFAEPAGTTYALPRPGRRAARGRLALLTLGIGIVLGSGALVVLELLA